MIPFQLFQNPVLFCNSGTMHDTDFTFDWVTYSTIGTDDGQDTTKDVHPTFDRITDSTIGTGDRQDTTKDVHPTFDWFTSSKISPGKLDKHQNLHYTLRR